MRGNADEARNLASFFDAYAVARFNEIVVSDIHIFSQVKSSNMIDEC